MDRLNPQKLHVSYSTGTTPKDLVIPRRYTLTHSDRTGELFLTIGSEYDEKQISSLYARLMKDEVLGELQSEQDRLLFKFYCHVSGGFIVGTAKWRYNIFQSELPLVLEAVRYGDRALFIQNPELDQTAVQICFQSKNKKFNTIEQWGIMADYNQ